MSRMSFGVHARLEAEADRLIKESLKGVTKHSEKADLLTPWKMSERYRREVYVVSGTPEAATRSGMFHRVANKTRPDMNSRDGICRANKMSQTLQTFVEENGTRPDD